VRGKKSDQAKRATTLAPVCETNLYYGDGAAAKKIRQKKSKITAKKERNRSSTKICGMRSSMLVNVTFEEDGPRTQEVHHVQALSFV
jgi:hypothetical protein